MIGPWGLLVIAGALEIVWALGFKYLWGRGLPWKALCIGALVLSMVLLIRALQALPAGTAYAVWTGIGAVGVAVLGILFFKEPATWPRIFFIALILAGIVGLKLATAPQGG